MFRNHEDRVNKLFHNNRKTVDRNSVALESDPRNIKLDMNKVHKNEGKNQDRIIESARRRYTHEKKVIVFMMHCCRRLRNLAKQRSQLGIVANGLMFVGVLLLKKGILLNQRAENTLQNNTNTFQIPNFETFMTTSNSKKILNELNKDAKLYKTLIQHIQLKLKDEVGLSDPTAQKIYQMSNSHATTL